MEKINLTTDLAISRIVHGLWRLSEWGLSDQELLQLIEQTIELGITTFDHADIYGNYSCDELFGNAIHLNKKLRANIQIVTKLGIKLKSNKYPERDIKYYDYSFDHIITTVNNSLRNFRTDYIDILLLHRPAPNLNPEEVSKAFSDLKKQGKVIHFGVSNFSALQFEMLNSYLDEKLVTNQVEISPYCLEHFDNGNMNFFLKERIKPMAWSPFAGGKIVNPIDEKGKRLFKALSAIAEELNVSNIDQIAYSWLLSHPSQIIPIIGTHKIDRIRHAIESLNMKLTMEQWYKIYNASTGKELP